MFELTPYSFSSSDPFALFDSWERNFFPAARQAACMRTDILDKGDHYVVQADLPGFHREDIQVHVQDNLLEIRASHRETAETKEDAYIRRERNCSSFHRRFALNGIRQEAIRAEYQNGVLKLTLPKFHSDTDNTGRTIPIQ